MVARTKFGSGPLHWPVALLGFLALLLVTTLPSCGPNESAFESEILPILENRCANALCHGTAPGAISSDGTRAKSKATDDGQPDHTKWLLFKTDSAGRITDRTQALASVKARVNARGKPEFSSLLRKTLPVDQGGTHHFMGAIFETRAAADYQTLARWVATLSNGTEGAAEPPLTVNETRFAETVYPLLVDRGCATASCHGSLMFGGLLMHTPPVAGTKELPRHELRETYLEMKRNVTLWGDPKLSRLIAKVVPVEFGGIPHKGGNDVFFAADVGAGKDPRDGPAVRAILDWIAAERTAVMGADAAPAPTGPPGTERSAKAGTDQAFPTLVAVGGPLAAAGPFEVQPFTPGTDLYRLDPVVTKPGATAPPGAMVTPVNLTASAHQGPADIRDPAISHDGKTIVFSMRKSPVDAHNLYTIGLDGAGLTQLTFDKSEAPNGLIIGNFSPVFGPNGGFVAASGVAPAERIYFSSTRAADLSDIAHVQNADLYVVDIDGKNLERLSFTVVPEVAPYFLASGEFSGTLAYTIKRSIEGGYKGVLFRFPICHNAAHHIQPEAHPHFGISEPQQVFYGLREMPEGRASVLLLDEHNVWRGGQLATLERQFAMELPDAKVPLATLPNFRHALSVLTPKASRTGVSADGLWRDATPLPDGSLVVAHAAGSLDLTDRKLAPQTRLLRLTLKEDRISHRPHILASQVLLSSPTMAWSQPVAVFSRATEDPPHERAWNNTDATATLLHSGVRVIEALVAQLQPLAARTLRDDIAYVRAVTPLSVAGPVDQTQVPAAETRHKAPGATRASLTGRMPLFAALEVPPASDGSLAAEIPAKVPVRVVTLDKDRVAVGALQHHWYATLPGERFPVGIPLTSYGARCGGCHGAMNGDKTSVLQPVTDFITQASVTASRFANADRRQPKTLPIIDSSFFVFVDFQQDVQPILTQKCATAGCHDAAVTAGGLSLTSQKTSHYTDAYESLLAPGTGSAGGFAYVDAHGYRARRSFLAEKVMQREYDAPRAMTQQCPPAASPQLTVDERLVITRWIEFGAAFVGLPGSAK